MAIVIEIENYGHPGSHPPAIITQDANNRFVTDAQIAAWDAAVGADGAAAAALASEQAAAASELAAGNSETAAIAAQAAAEAARDAALSHETDALGAATAADASEVAAGNAQAYAEEWANAPEDQLVSAAAGGDQVDDYSALHWAKKAEKPTAVYTDAYNLFTAGYAATPLAVAAGAAVLLDLAARNVFTITADQNIVLSNPVMVGAGTWYLYVTVDAIGSRTLGFGGNFHLNAGAFDGSANAVNIITLVSDGTKIDVFINQRV